MRKLICLLTLLAALPASAVTFNAATCSIADVTTALTSSSDGDTINIPGGSCTWNATLTVSKAVTIQGAGATLDSGFVTGGVASGSTNLAGGRFTVTVAAGKTVVIGGFNLTGTAGFNMTTASKSWRIHHVRFTQVTGFTQNRHIWIEGTSNDYTQGVIDHIEVYDPNGIQIHPRETMWGGNNSWMRPLDLGGPDAIYIEDSYFSQPTSSYDVSSPITDCDGGGRLVFRHNTIFLNYFEMHDAVVPGSRSCRKWEVYQNTWVTTAAAMLNPGQFAQIAIRGGTGMVWSNRLRSTTFSNDMTYSNYRTYQGNNGDPWNALCQSSGAAKACLNGTTAPITCTSDSQCGGQAGSCQKIDGSGGSGLPTNYPCRDQMGTSGNIVQGRVPALFWDNRFDGGANNNIAAGPVSLTVNGSPVLTYTVANRDYCITTSATMPMSCGGITTQYTPYTYPHPLALGIIAPRTPGNLTVQ